MKWNVVCRIGEDDKYSPNEATVNRNIVLHFSGGAPHERVRENVVSTIEDKYKVKLSEPIQDILYAAMCVYAVDLYIPRRTGSDRWSREIIVHLPVFIKENWQEAAEYFCESLNFLTGDRWVFSFRDRIDDPPIAKHLKTDASPDAVSLISGGLDSLVGAIDLLSNNKKVAFVSHYGGGITGRVQSDTLNKLNNNYPKRFYEDRFYITKPIIGKDYEKTMRSRSLLFISLGVTIASIFSNSLPLVIAENGFISLNIPLTGTRVGSSSTRTTHPYFINNIQMVLDKLNIDCRIKMPYRHMTKGEMLLNGSDIEVLKDILGLTMSCAHPEAARYMKLNSGIHCGYCYPCLIRQAAVHTAGLGSFDAHYATNIHNKTLSDKKGRDLRAVKIALLRNEQYNKNNIFRVFETGPLPKEEIKEYTEVFDRGLAELKAFLEKG